MIIFEDYINGYIHKTDYQMEEVRKNFDKVISILGEEDEDDFIAEMNKPVTPAYSLETPAAKTSNADKFNDLFND